MTQKQTKHINTYKEGQAWIVIEAVLKIASPNGNKMRLQVWLLKNNRSDLMKVTTILQSMQKPYPEIVNDTKVLWFQRSLKIIRI